jgi:hypothetical protein
MRRRKRWLALVGLAALASAGWGATSLRPYHPEPWLADLAQLESATASAYANLEYVVARGRVDPAALHRRTDSAIRHAGSDREARRALQEFARAFEDGHFHVVRQPPAFVETAMERWSAWRRGEVTAALDGASACGRLGYGVDASRPLLASADGWRAIEDGAFPTGMIEIGGRPVGVLQIASFDVSRVGGACAAEWERFRTTLAEGAVCDEGCENAFYDRLVDAVLGDLARRIESLRAAGAEALVVDLTGNGGGNEWVDPATRLFSPRPLHGSPSGWIRHEHVVGPLTETRSRIAGDLERVDLAPDVRATLVGALASVDRRIAEARQGCDRTAIWTEGTAGVRCSLLLATPSYTTGLVPYAAPGAFEGLASAGDLFGAADTRYREGVWQGPLAVLVDGRTASAAEEFAVLLQDNDAARVVGERTLGAGCGYTYGGLPVTLRNSGLLVKMPDCVRWRRNGANELDGIAPDHLAHWEDGDDDAARAAKALVAIDAALRR